MTSQRTSVAPDWRKLAAALLAALSSLLAGLSIAPAQTAKIDFGEPAPDWLRESESYAFTYAAGNWDVLAQSKVKFITHCPVNRDFFTRCHALGIHCLPYVTFYQGFATETYEGVNLKDSPQLIEVDAKGNLKRTSFWESEDAKNMYMICPNVLEYQNAMVAWVEKIMDLGADGVFVDNISRRAPCYGPKFGKHKHLYEDQNHAFAMLLDRVRKVIKRHKPDGALLVNSASPLQTPAEYWKYIDADMLESYICTWVSKDRWFDWKTHWHEQGVKLQPYLAAGKQVQALSYLGHTPYGIKEDAFFCYATARLAGFVWNGGVPISQPDVAPLYRLRLGKPLSAEVEENGVYWRPFEVGLVAVNPDREKEGSITVRPPIPAKRFFDFFSADVEHWTPYGHGYAVDTVVKHGSGHAVRCVNEPPVAGAHPTKGRSGARRGTAPQPVAEEAGLIQSVTLDQKEPLPVVASGWSKAQDVSGMPDCDYALYLDILYQDGTPLYGQAAPFACGTHSWQRASVAVRPAKPIKSLTYNVLFRHKTGRVWFDDLSLKVLGKPPREMLVNGGFEEISSSGRLLDTDTSDKLVVPAYSGRVFLYAPHTDNELTKVGTAVDSRHAATVGRCALPRRWFRLLDSCRPLGHRIRARSGVRPFYHCLRSPWQAHSRGDRPGAGRHGDARRLWHG